MEHLANGRIREAELGFQQVVAVEPGHSDALHLLGLIAYQRGDFSGSVDFIKRALAINPQFVDALNNLGLAQKQLGRIDDAISSFRKILIIDTNDVDAYNNLGLLLREQGQQEEAENNFRRAIKIAPNHAKALNNLGNVLQDNEHFEEAKTCYLKVLTIEPDSIDAQNNLGAAYLNLGSLDEAVDAFRKVLAIDPNNADAQSNLANTLRDQGKLDEAFTCHRQAVSMDPANELYWLGMAATVARTSFLSADEQLLTVLLDLLDQPKINRPLILRPILNALGHHPDIGKILENTASWKPELVSSYSGYAVKLSSIPLFLRALEAGPVSTAIFERMLTLLRRAMLAECLANVPDEDGAAFAVALALQCFSNEYVFYESDEESGSVEKLQRNIESLAKKEEPIPISFIAAMGAYRPLHVFPWAEKLSHIERSDHETELIRRQVTEPLVEWSLREKIPQLTPVQHEVSQLVREQYEENPYPRWDGPISQEKSGSIAEVLTAPPLYFDLGDYISPATPEILIAGCGTGQQTLHSASRFSNAQVLSVDISLTSIAHAMRKTEELNISNIDYAQADILELGDLARSFDLIECTGVLHHLDDPMAGWRVLTDLLRSGGLMKIGLYSELGRQDVVRARSIVAEKGYSASPDDIRQFRQDIILEADEGIQRSLELCNSVDFYCLSGCRDLLFHAQEHRFELPEIGDALDSLGLKFLGFEMRDQATIREFDSYQTDRSARASLSAWHQFEVEHPQTFRSMYLFWCVKN